VDQFVPGDESYRITFSLNGRNFPIDPKMRMITQATEK
jgi:hypothetical protein